MQQSVFFNAKQRNTALRVEIRTCVNKFVEINNYVYWVELEGGEEGKIDKPIV